METKHIDRGSVFKLISTYNNGNIFGICLLMLLPLYRVLEESRWRQSILKLALFLTLSRTIWIGLIFSEFCFDLFVLKNQRLVLLKFLLSFVLMAGGMWGAAFFFKFNPSFFFDKNLGGRSDQLEGLSESGFFSSETFTVIPEIVYTGILRFFGIAGLATFFLAMAGPILLAAFRRPSSPIKTSITLGLANYLLISCSDGAILLIPTMAFYWFLASLLSRRQFLFSSRSAKIQSVVRLDSRPSPSFR